MSFFSMSQKERVISSTNILQKKDKMSFRTEQPYSKASQNLNQSLSINPTRIFSPMKNTGIGCAQKEFNNNPILNGLFKSNEGQNPTPSTSRNFLNASAMFPPNNPNRSYGFQPLAKPRPNPSNSFFCGADNGEALKVKNGLSQKSNNAVDCNNVYEDTKMKLTEFLGNEFNNFKNDLQNVDVFQKKEFDDVLKKVDEELTQKLLDPYLSLMKSTTEQIENEVKTLNNSIKTNTKAITEKYGKFTKVFNDLMKSIETQVTKSKENMDSIQEGMAKISGLLERREITKGERKDEDKEEQEEQEEQQFTQEKNIENICNHLAPKTKKKPNIRKKKKKLN